MAEPSASSEITGRPGAATAAPVAAGRPQPIAPPVRYSQSCSGAAAVRSTKNADAVTASSTTIAPSGNNAPTAAVSESTFSSPVGGAGRSGGVTGGGAGASSASASASSAATASSSGPASAWTAVSGEASRLGRPG